MNIEISSHDVEHNFLKEYEYKWITGYIGVKTFYFMSKTESFPFI